MSKRDRNLDPAVTEKNQEIMIEQKEAVDQEIEIIVREMKTNTVIITETTTVLEDMMITKEGIGMTKEEKRRK